MKLGKKSVIATSTLLFGALIIGAFLFAGGGILTFLLSDKTPLIIGLAFIALILFSKRR